MQKLLYYIFFPVRIQTLEDEGKTILQDCYDEMYVNELKEKYAEVVDMPIDSIRFSCGGVECRDD